MNEHTEAKMTGILGRQGLPTQIGVVIRQGGAGFVPAAPER